MIVDTNVIIRALTNDDPQKAQRFKNFLEAGNEFRLLDVTVAEIYWTLQSFYEFPRKKIIESLESLIQRPTVACNQAVLQETFNILRKKRIGFVDAYTISAAKVVDDGEVLSFDRDFDKFDEVKRVEP